MNSLLSYGSDDELDDYPDEKLISSHGSTRNYRKPGVTKQDDTNYDEVQMSLSEDSDSEPKNAKSSQSRDRNDDRRRSPNKDRHRSDDRSSRNRERDEHDKGRSRDDDKDRTRDRYKNDRDDDKSRDKRDDRQRSRSKERSSSSRDDRYSRDRKDRSERRRSRSRERRRSRSPRRHDRSRSRSRDRGNRGGYYRRNDRPNNRFNNRGDPKLENHTEIPQNPDETQPKDRFFMPGITGRFRDQIEKRKLLWQKNKVPEVQETLPTTSKTTKVWEATTFAQDTDGKVASKFKRLMGIRNPGEGSGGATEGLKKQEEMFSSMEAQYEVARTATHTMRGVGLGFGSFQR